MKGEKGSTGLAGPKGAPGPGGQKGDQGAKGKASVSDLRVLRRGPVIRGLEFSGPEGQRCIGLVDKFCAGIVLGTEHTGENKAQPRHSERQAHEPAPAACPAVPPAIPVSTTEHVFP